jgi:hypothetical protein
VERLETGIGLHRGEPFARQTMLDRIAEWGDGVFWLALEREDR